MVVVRVTADLEWWTLAAGHAVTLLPAVPGAQWRVGASALLGTGPFVAELLSPVPLTDEQWVRLAECDWLTVDKAPWNTHL